MVKDILESHKVYTLDLHIELLRHYEKLILSRNSQAEAQKSTHNTTNATIALETIRNGLMSGAVFSENYINELIGQIQQ